MALFRQNVGGLDRVIRLGAGILLLATGLLTANSGGGLGATLMVVGGLVLFSGLARFCILYVPFGLSTLGPRQPSAAERAARG